MWYTCIRNKKFFDSIRAKTKQVASGTGTTITDKPKDAIHEQSLCKAEKEKTMKKYYEVITLADNKEWLVENTNPLNKSNPQYLPIIKVEQIAELQEKLAEAQKTIAILHKGQQEAIGKVHRRNLQIAELKKKISELPIEAIASLIYTEGEICKQGNGRVTNSEIATQKRSLKAMGAIPYDEKFKAIYASMDIHNKENFERLFS